MAGGLGGQPGLHLPEQETQEAPECVEGQGGRSLTGQLQRQGGLWQATGNEMDTVHSHSSLTPGSLAAQPSARPQGSSPGLHLQPSGHSACLAIIASGGRLTGLQGEEPQQVPGLCPDPLKQEVESSQGNSAHAV